MSQIKKLEITFFLVYLVCLERKKDILFTKLVTKEKIILSGWCALYSDVLGFANIKRSAHLKLQVYTYSKVQFKQNLLIMI